MSVYLWVEESLFVVVAKLVVLSPCTCIYINFVSSFEFACPYIRRSHDELRQWMIRLKPCPCEHQISLS